MSPLLTLTQTFEFRLVFQSVFVLAILLAVFSESSLHAQNQEKFRFSAWNTGLKSTAFANCRILVKAENFRRTSDNSSGMGERAATTHYEILRRQEYCRIVDVMVMVGEPGIKTVLELCYTDQYLHLQGNNVSDPALEPKLSASGCLDVKEVEFYPADGLLGPASLIFGVVSFSGDWQPRLAEFVDSDSQDPAFLDFGPIGKVTVLFANGVPNEIEHSFGSITRDTATRKINRIKRNHSEINVIRYSKIVWNAVSIGFIPESYTYDQYLIVDGNRQPLVSSNVKIEQVELEKSLSDAFFLPTYELKTGTPITVSDVPVACEWRNNRIQPVSPTGTWNLGFETPSILRILSFLGPSIVLCAIAYMLWMRRFH